MSNKLTYYERQMLQYWLKTKLSLRKIAKLLRRDHSIIVREIKKNGNDRKKYRADMAQTLSEKQKHKPHKGKLDKFPKLKEYIETKLLQDWSPEQIAGRLKENPPDDLKGISLSHESIYLWIYEKAEEHKQLYQHLRTYRLKRKSRGKRKSEKITIPGRISIQERPMTVNAKKRYGDWESDTVEFKRIRGNAYLSVQYERKSQLMRMHKVTNKTAEETKEALIKTAESVLPELFKTVTFDNGKEGSLHNDIKDIYGIETYFCDPFSSWQKGGVENMNKLIRQYFPRRIDMSKISDELILFVQERLNNRPRKSLNYLTPNEIIQKVVL